MKPTQARDKILKNEKEVAELKRYIELVDGYRPETFTEHVVYKYALTGSLLDVVDFVNAASQDKRYTQADISAIIRSKPGDELHKVVQKFLKKKDVSKKRY